jgi:AraC-like DNA-binding protein
MSVRFEDISVHILNCRLYRIPDWNWSCIETPFWRCLWNSQPGWKVVCDGESVPLGPDHWVVIPPETSFEAVGHNMLNHFFLEFTTPFSRHRFLPKVHSFAIDEPALETIHTIATLQTENMDDAAVRRSSCLMTHLASSILSQIPDEDIEHPPRDARIRDVMDFLENSTDQTYSNEELAQRLHLSTNAFIRLFRGQTGVSPQQWHCRRRIEVACSLLHRSSLSIEQIAQQTGFCDRYHFSKVFKQYRQVAPGVFRDTHDGMLFRS